MIFNEFAKKSGFLKKDYAASVVIVPEGEDHFLSELSQAGGALTDWHSRRGKNAKDIIFTMVCEQSQAAMVKELIISVFTNTPEFIDLVRAVDVDVHMIDEQENVLDEFSMRL